MRQQLPEQLRGWRPETDEDPADLLPTEFQLPEPEWDYLELETMKAFGCWHLAAWRTQSADDRARLMAHEIHRSLRERWTLLKGRRAREKKTAPVSEAPWDFIERQFMRAKPA